VFDLENLNNEEAMTRVGSLRHRKKMLHNYPEERSSHLLHDGSLKSRGVTKF